MRTLIFLSVFLWAVPSLGQVNTEEFRSGGPKGHTGFSSSSTLGGTLNRGNVKANLFNTSVRLGYRLNKHHFFSHTDYSHGSSDKGLFQEAGFTHLRWTAMWEGAWGSDLFLQAQYDRFKNLKLRTLGGGGVRLVGGELDTLVCALGLGAMAEHEVLREGKGDYLAWRSTNYLSASLNLEDKDRLTLVAYYQPKLSEPTDYRLSLDAVLETHLMGNLYVAPVFSYRFDAKPPQGVGQVDMVLKYTLTLRYE